MTKKYRVWAQSIDVVYIDIEAESEDQAYEFARDFVDGGEFHNHGYGDWEMGDIDELDDPDGNLHVDYTYNDVIEIME